MANKLSPLNGGNQRFYETETPPAVYPVNKISKNGGPGRTRTFDQWIMSPSQS